MDSAETVQPENKKTWQKPDLIIIDFEQTKGLACGLFEDSFGIAS